MGDFGIRSKVGEEDTPILEDAATVCFGFEMNVPKLNSKIALNPYGNPEQTIYTQDAVNNLSPVMRGVDLTGIWASGKIFSGNANSLGLEHWFETETFSLDYYTDASQTTTKSEVKQYETAISLSYFPKREMTGFGVERRTKNDARKHQGIRRPRTLGPLGTL